jgi:hypothetical protein
VWLLACPTVVVDLVVFVDLVARFDAVKIAKPLLALLPADELTARGALLFIVGKHHSLLGVGRAELEGRTHTLWVQKTTFWVAVLAW